MLVNRGKLKHFFEIDGDFIDGDEKSDVMFFELLKDTIHACAPVALGLLSICPIDAHWTNLNAVYARVRL